jgi:hypothetical protein
VHVLLKDGSTLSTSVKMPVGSTAAPLTHAQLLEKFDGCAKDLVPAKSLSSIKSMLANLGGNQSIKTLMTGLRRSDSIKSGSLNDG